MLHNERCEECHILLSWDDITLNDGLCDECRLRDMRGMVNRLWEDYDDGIPDDLDD